jgi:cytochrome c556
MSYEWEPDQGNDEAAMPATWAQMQEWHAERDRVVGLAYRMLGSAFEAEEVVQEAFLTWTPSLLTVQVAGVCRTSGSCRQVVATSAGVR